ncbi:PD-(D/E)XK nuclease family protein [Pseudoalteromonas sp. SS15]|uniref:PD-(D/E)XK nuclease family protein n=1 Tax=Pseudoalteromonas sp. SS15 TaxID=3139393 RepID=UPI003BAAFA5E
MSKLITNLLSLITDKDFQALENRCVVSSTLELIKFDENRKSDLLAWLFNPKEGHLQNEYFLKALINAAFSSIENTQEGTIPNSADIALKSLSNIQVVRELAIDETGTKKFIDLFLIDPFQKVVITIERKDGSYAHSNQLRFYADWVESNYKGWSHLFILSDSESKDHNDEFDPRYIQLDDSWLCDALLDLIDRGRVSKYLETQFRDIHDFIFGEWEETRDKYYSRFDEITKRVAKVHCETLRLLEEYKITINSSNYHLLDITPNLYFTKILPQIALIDNEAQQLLAVTQQHYSVFEQLHGLNEFDELEDKLSKLFGNEILTELHADNIYFTLGKHFLKGKYWPISFEIKRNRTELDEAKYVLNLCISKYSDEAHHALADHIAEAFNKPFRKNQKEVKLTNLGEFSDLDLSVNSELSVCIKKNLEKVSEFNLA